MLVQVALLSITLLGFYLWKLKLSLDEYRARGLTCVPFWTTFKANVQIFLRTEQLGEIFDSFYNKYKNDKIVLVTLKPIILLTDPEYIHKVLVKDFSYFNFRGMKTDLETNPLDGNLFMTDGEKWKALRNKMSPTFTSGKLKDMVPLMMKCVKEFSEAVRGKHEVFELQDYAGCFSTDVIASCAFGLETNSLKDPENEFRRMGKRAMTLTPWENFVVFLTFIWPSMLKLKLKTMSKSVVQFFISIVSQAFEERLRTGKKRNDFLQLLLELREKGTISIDPKDKSEENPAHELENDVHIDLTDELLTAQAANFFNAGFDTTAATICYTIYELAKHPKIQDRVRQEIREVKKANGVTFSTLKEMKYLTACLEESLRLHPPIRVLFRECTKPYSFENGVKVEKGDAIFISIRALHVDPEYFEDPLIFRPERFIESRPRPGTYIPFGNGPRICIGQRFALLQIKAFIAEILDAFEVTIDPRMKDPDVIEKQPFVTRATYGFWLKFKPLN